MRKQPHKPAAVPTPFLLISLFLSGGVALALGLAGSRLIVAALGPSSQVRPALLAAALAALAAGCAWGGHQADRQPHLTLYARLLTATGLTLAAVPWLSARVLPAVSPLGAGPGAAAAAAVLLGPALALLGTLAPLAARLTAPELAKVGRCAGEAWAVFAAGGAAGAVLTDLVLLPLWPAPRVLLGAAAVMLVLGAWGSWISTRGLPLARLAACAACLALLAVPKAALD